MRLCGAFAGLAGTAVLAGILDYFVPEHDLEVVPFPAQHVAVADSDMTEPSSWIAERWRV